MTRGDDTSEKPSPPPLLTSNIVPLSSHDQPSQVMSSRSCPFPELEPLLRIILPNFTKLSFNISGVGRAVPTQCQPSATPVPPHHSDIIYFVSYTICYRGIGYLVSCDCYLLFTDSTILNLAPCYSFLMSLASCLLCLLGLCKPAWIAVPVLLCSNPLKLAPSQWSVSPTSRVYPDSPDL